MNVVKKMKEVNSIVGGEGGGGIIYPELHYGRDALVGTALFLGLIVEKGTNKVSDLKNDYSKYFMTKLKVSLKDDKVIDNVFKKIISKYSNLSPNTEDGIRIDFSNGWIIMRTSNTEPIVRIFSESDTQQQVESLAKKIYNEIKSLSN